MTRVCCECGERKPVEKFFAGQQQCRACRVGVTTLNRRRAAEVVGRRDGEPTEDEIAELCSAIQAGWSRLRREARRRKAVTK